MRVSRSIVSLVGLGAWVITAMLVAGGAPTTSAFQISLSHRTLARPQLLLKGRYNPLTMSSPRGEGEQEPPKDDDDDSSAAQATTPRTTTASAAETKKEEEESAPYPVDLPSPILLGTSIVIAIASTGSLFEVLGGSPAIGFAPSAVIIALGFPLTIFLFYASIKKAIAETEEDDKRFLSGR